MAYIVDIIIVIIFGAIIISSIKKGFFKSLFELIGTLLAVVIARVLSQNFAPTVFDGFVRGIAEGALSKNLGDVGTTDYAVQAEQALASIPESMNGIMSIIGIDKQAILDKITTMDLGGDNLVDTIMINIVEPIGTAVVQFILFALMAFALTFVIKIVVKLLDKVIKALPAVKQLNSTLGAVFGVVRGLIIVVIVSMVIGVVSSFINNELFNEAVSNSIIINTVQDLITSISGTAV